MSAGGKPIGIIIIAILQLLSALSYLGLGAVAMMLGLATPLFGIIEMFLAAILLIIGIIGLILFYGLWTLKHWAWTWTLIINILGVIFGILGGIFANWLSVIISIVIIVYLFVPSTKAAFK
jgi:hypothetical protein